MVFLFMKKTAYEIRISDWSSDVCSSDLPRGTPGRQELNDPHSPCRRRPWSTLVDPGRADLIRIKERATIQGKNPCRRRSPATSPSTAASPTAGCCRATSGPTTNCWNCAGSGRRRRPGSSRSEEHTSELQSLMRLSYAVFCLKKKK